MDILSYTSYAEIRATCGLSLKELPDSELSLEIYQNILALELGNIDLPTETPGPGPLSTRFLEIEAISPDSARTTLEQKLYDLTRVFCTYVVALEVVVSLSIKAPKTISDSKASLVRFSPESVYKDVITRIEKVLGEVRGKIENIAETNVDSLPLLTAIPPSIDPITGV